MDGHGLIFVVQQTDLASYLVSRTKVRLVNVIWLLVYSIEVLRNDVACFQDIFGGIM